MDVTWQPSTEIVRLTRLCLISKTVPLDVRDYDKPFSDIQKIEIHFPKLFQMLLQNDITKFEDCTTKVLPNLIILYLQRSLVNNWNSPIMEQQVQKLNSLVQSKYDINLNEVLMKINEKDFKAQELFDNTMMELNRKVYSNEHLRLYPGLVTVYYILVQKFEIYGVYLNPMLVCPISILLMEDFEPLYKSNGLQCLWTIMQSMNENNFNDGNYYEVIFDALKGCLRENNLKVTKETLLNLLKFIQDMVPHDMKTMKRDEILDITLELVQFETNLRRKKELLTFLKCILDAHQSNCISRKLLKTVLCDQIHICCNDAVADILLVDVIDCVHTWISHCWCIWRLSTDHELISSLIKLLYVSRKERIASHIQALISTLIALCSKEEKIFIYNNLDTCQITAPEFREKLDEIKREIDIT